MVRKSFKPTVQLISTVHLNNETPKQEPTVAVSQPNGENTASTFLEDDDFEYIGLSLEDVIRLSEERKWRIMRNLVFFATFILILALVITAIVSALDHPRCRARPNVNWWNKAVYYRIYVPMFHDSNSDCVGDIKGVEMQLDYLKDMGVDAISLSPIYNGIYMGSDVSVVDHLSVDNKFGTEEDIKSLIAAAHKKNMHVVLDFIPNETSEKHPWFLESSSSQPGDKNNYYLWVDNSSLLNNWVSVEGKSAWSNTVNRSSYFLHQFSPKTPDLNLYSRAVVDQLNKIPQYWISLGVDGFNIRHSGFLLEDYDLRNDTELNTTKPNAYDNLLHVNTFGLERNMVLLSEWNHLVAENSGKNGRSLLTGMDNWDRTITSYRNNYGVMNLPHLTYCRILNTDTDCSGTCMKNFVKENMKNVSIGTSTTWLLGSDTMSRFSTRLGNNTNRKEVLTMIGLLLPGSVVLYYGDELDMTDSTGQKVKSRTSRSHPWRTPMKWDNISTEYSFSNSSCGQAPSSNGMNVEEAKSNSTSMLNFIKKLMKLRKEDAFRWSRASDIQYGPDNDQIFSFVRGFDGVNCYLVAVNLGSKETCADLSSIFGGDDAKATLVLVTPGITTGYSEEDVVDTTCVNLKPNQGVVLTWSCGLYFK